MINKTVVILLLVWASVITSQTTFAQNVNLKHAVYAELAGTAGAWSVNYDLTALEFGSFKVGARIGIGMLSEGYEGSTVDIHIPLTANFMYTLADKHHVELGLGTQIMSYDIRDIISPTEIGFTRKTEALGTYTFGYRYQSPDGGIVFRAFYGPFFYQDGIYFRYEHWGGISIGYAFKSGGK